MREIAGLAYDCAPRPLPCADEAVNRIRALLLVGSLLGLGPACAAAAPAQPQRVTAPLTFEQNRPYVALMLSGPSGQNVRARFWLDTGGGAVILAGPLARRLGLQSATTTFVADGERLAASELPGIALAGMPLELQDVGAYVVASDEPRLDGTGAEGALPLRALRGYHVVVDYPRARLTIAWPGKLAPEGVPVPATFSKDGFVAVKAKVDGQSYGFLLDTGAQYCMISADVQRTWQQAHPAWPHATGAYGPADMMLGNAEASFRMLRIGVLQWGPFTLTDVGSVSRPSGSYEKKMSRLTGTPVIGSVGGNVLRNFRLDIDYPQERVYLMRLASGEGRPIAMVGVTLERAGNGYVVAGVASGETALRTGDRLVRIGSLEVAHATRAGIMRALSGAPGETRTLVVERAGKTLTVTALVRSIL